MKTIKIHSEIFAFVLYSVIFGKFYSICPEPRVIRIGILDKPDFPRDRIGAFNLAKSIIENKTAPHITQKITALSANFVCIQTMTIEMKVAKVTKYTSLPTIMRWVNENKLDGIFQLMDDACDYEAALSGALNVAFFATECSNVELSDKRQFPTFARTNPPISKAVKSIIALMHKFSWTKFALVSSSSRQWKLASDELKQVAHKEKIIIKFEKYINEDNASKSMKEIIDSTSKEIRIYVIMTSVMEILDFINVMNSLQIANSGEYVIIWVSDKFVNKFELYFKNIKRVNKKMLNVNDNFPTAAMRSMLFLSTATPNPIILEALGLAICHEGFNGICNLKRFTKPQQITMVKSILTAATFHTFDLTMMFFKAIDNIFQRNDSELNGTKILKEIFDQSFKSVTGLNVYMDKHGDAEGNFTVSSYTEMETGQWNITPVAYFIQNLNNTLPKFTMFPGRQISWISGHPPFHEPKCGFSNENCRLELNILALSVCVCVIVAGALFLLVAIRYWINEQKLSNLLWKVDFKDVMITDVLPEYDNNKPRNYRNIDNHYSFLVADEFESRRKPRSSCKIRKTFTKIGSYKGMIVSIKFLNHKSIELTRKFRQEMQFFKDMNQENLNRIIGVCLDPPNICILTLYCSRGSLKDILSNKDIFLDEIFVASLLFDLIKGMIYLHDSQINYHGNLRTSKCLIDSRWILQITGFGLQSIRYASPKDPSNWPHSLDAEKYYYSDIKYFSHLTSQRRAVTFWGPDAEKLLWKSPEHLKEPYPMSRGSQKGDIYSFAIIFHELTHQTGPWGSIYRPGNATEIIRKLKNETSNELSSMRPIIDETQVPNFVKDCLTECWDDVSERRPDFKFIRVILKPLLKGLRSNIFDNMLLIMEKYAKNLEVLVEERTWQLSEEKKKIERLLLRMLPKSVTEQLKVGQTVIPEHYSCVTIYFSDIVGFTSLSASSTPMEVVQMLNDLYTLFDSIIIEYDVYKVETIGDAYMVVSGLPMRNADLHAGEIASLSLHLLKAIKSFVIRHRPNETLKLRIGIHSGPCVAGVVGLKMPRYCLFGDTVNTASRMEATGEALKIHTSSETKFLLDALGGYCLIKRGNIEVKGKGDMITYFLESEDPNVRQERLIKMKIKERKISGESQDTPIEMKLKYNLSEENLDADEFLRKISLSSHNSMNTNCNVNVLPTVDFKESFKSTRFSTHRATLHEYSSPWKNSSFSSQSEHINLYKKPSEVTNFPKNGSLKLMKESLNHVIGDIDATKSLLHES